MAADGSSYACRSTDDLLAQATETFNRQGTIARQMNGGLAWTAVEAATVMTLVINEVTFKEATQLGQPVQYVQKKTPGPTDTRAASRRSEQVEGRQRSTNHRRGGRF